MSDKGNSFKEKGNDLFKQGRMADPLISLSKAEAAAPNNATYPSNLSAALYETGAYGACFEAISRAWERLSSNSNPSLALRLSVRLAKTLLHGVYSGSVSLHTVQDRQPIIGGLKAVALQASNTSGSNAEHLRVWKDWEKTEKSLPYFEAAPKEGRAQLSSLPIFRPSCDTLQYFVVGTDDLISLTDDFGDRDPYPLVLDKLDPELLPDVSFLFGGVGDGRHVLGTFVGMHRAYDKLSHKKSKQAKLRFHLTLLDIHPTMVTRDLCLFMLFRELMEAPQDRMTQLEIKTTILYVLWGVVMPSYCHDRLRNVINTLLSLLSQPHPQLPSWIHVDLDSVGPILSVLDYWKDLVNRKTVKKTLENHSPPINADPMSMINRTPGISMDYRANIAALLDNMTDSDIRQLGLVPAHRPISEARKMLSQNREKMIDMMLKESIGGTPQGGFEQEWYTLTKCFLPPPEFWTRHPGFDLYRRMKTTGSIPDINEHIRTAWVPNVTFFATNGSTFGVEYPNLSAWNPFTPIRLVADFNERFRLSGEGTPKPIDATASDHMNVLIDGVIKSIKALSGRFKLEFICGELTQELAKMHLGSDVMRPPSFPRLFTRMWISNIPDYTHGALHTAMYCVHRLQPDPQAAVASNCMLNLPAWGNPEQKSYTLLQLSDMPRYLGCRLLRAETRGVFLYSKNTLPKPLAKLATREELTAWLTRILLYSIIPAPSDSSPNRVRLPNSLVAFVDLLIHLSSVGFPGHWLSEYVQKILADEIITDISPYDGLYPLPMTDDSRKVPRRRIRLDPWHYDFEAILAVACEGLPFPVPFPSGFATSAPDIGVFETKIDRAYSFVATSHDMFSPYDRVCCLLFYNPKKLSDPNSIVSRIPSMLEGSKEIPVGHVQIITSADLVDVPGEKARWRMSRTRFRQMKEEKWPMFAYRTDARFASE
ncbi:hypothetical protein JAAARDRAFT_179150 [Jaapia argillacea MUCL 33604]|uniref:DUF4470 domain-containing protein n=1 Tax=Jaapia argillacea MUCL 33604 TaxID=933084 RepID=A0A067PP64_9AGAM|nr:hypothetical protein JAAARDRAFT_179150 [Jaapia argillacea MUCL 33604]